MKKLKILTIAGIILMPVWLRSSDNSWEIQNQGEFPLNYEAYGKFHDLGKNEYRYKISDRAGLSRAMGEGLFPNNGSSLKSDPEFQKWKESIGDSYSPWEFVQTGDPQSEYYAWVNTNQVSPGIRTFYTANALSEAGFYTHAAKAYHAVLVFFPKEICWSSDHTFFWYVGHTALNHLESLMKHHPEIGYRLEKAEFEVENGNDTDTENDVFKINPGEWVKRKGPTTTDLSKVRIKKRRGKGDVSVVKYRNGQWQLLVNGEPYFVKGVSYSPTQVGKGPGEGKGNEWMYLDKNNNGKADAPFDSYVDKNKNNNQDPSERSVGDFSLMRDMGVNTIRLFRTSSELEYDPEEFNKPLLRTLTKKYGIRVIMGDFLGAYTIGSGADWEDGTDYTNREQLDNMRNLIRDYVNDHKDEPYVLMWSLGNENLMKSEYGGVNATRTKASTQVKAYLRFVNDIAKMIHKLDPHHPVAVGNLGLRELEAHAKYAPEVDIFGTNLYRGSYGFGDLWKRVANILDRPVLLMEFGCDAFDSNKNEENEQAQAEYHRGAWSDIELHRGGGAEEGNSIGGVVFEFIDEWWKSQQGAWSEHDGTQDSSMAFPDGWSSEEYLGLVSQGDGSDSPFLRQPRKVYYLYKNELWN